MITGGVSRLVAAEFYSRALRQVYAGDVRVLVLGDFDPGGSLAGRTLVEHFASYAVNCPTGPEFLVSPSAYTREELDLFFRPQTLRNPRRLAAARRTPGGSGRRRPQSTRPLSNA